MSIAFTENCMTKMIVDFKFEKRKKMNTEEGDC